jgi:hypothetical protein
MKDEDKTKKQLIIGLNPLRQGIAGFEKSGASQSEWRRS